MGLDTTHDCWHGPYSAFSRWRNGLAEVAGYEIFPIVYDDLIKRDTIMIDWGHIPEGALMGDWKRTPDDPLLVLIAHSDCEGVIHPEQAAPLAERLEGLMDQLSKEIDFSHGASYQDKTRKFIDGLRLAVSRGEDVEFG